MNVADPGAAREVVEILGMNGVSSRVGSPFWATPWATCSQVSMNAGQSIWPSLAARASGSMRQSTSKTAHHPAIRLSSSGKIVVLPDPDAPVTTKSGRITTVRSTWSQAGQRAAPPTYCMRTGSSQALQ
jgi:hypothetical protein